MASPELGSASARTWGAIRGSPHGPPFQDTVRSDHRRKTLTTKAARLEAKGDALKKKRGRGKREIVLLSALAILIILLVYLFTASSSRAEQAAPQTPPAKAQKAPEKTEKTPPTPKDAAQQAPEKAEQVPPPTPEAATQQTTPPTAAPGTQQPASPAGTQAPQPPTAEQRIEELRTKVAADPLNSQLHYELANALHDADLRDEALVEYDRALGENPKFVEAIVNKGAVLNELGRISEAIAAFNSALALKPNDPRALCNLGNSFYALKDYDIAFKNYRLAVQADSTFGEGYYYIGIAFADAGMYREAVREWETILRVAPGSEAAKTAKENIDALRSFMTSQ